MSVQNEIVTFEAKIQLDESSAARLTDGLKDATASCQSLSSAINATSKAMDKLRAEGKENTEEFKALKAQLDNNKRSLKDAQKAADQYAAALGTNNMSMKQLQQQAKQLRFALNSMHKEANPALWDKYQKELRDTNNRMKELKDGSKNTEKATGGLAEGMIKKLPKAAGVIGGVVAGVLAIGRAFIDAMNMTQKWGDKVGEVTAGVKAVLGHVVSQISGWNKITIQQIKEVWEAAKEAQQLRDGLFEKNNALKIAEAEARIAIAKEMKIVNDSTKSAEERLAAQQRVLDIELELAETRKSIAADSLKAAELDIKRLGMTPEHLRFLVDNYNQNEEIITKATEYLKKEKELNDLRADQAKVAEKAEGKGTDSKQFKEWERIKAEADALEESLKSSWTLEQQGVMDILKDYELGCDEMIEAYVNARVQQIEADAQYHEAEAQQGRKRSTLIKQMTDEEKKRREGVYNDKIKEADDAYTKQMTDLKNSLADRKITEDEFHEQSLAAEMAYLLQKKAINQAYGKEVVDIDSEIADLRLKAGVPTENVNRPTTDLSVSGDLMAKLPSKATSDSDPGIAKTFDMEMTALNILHEAKAISEEEYLKRRNELYEKYGIEQQEQEQSLWDQGMEGKLQATQMVLDGMSQAMNAARDAELASLDAQMQAELAAAGDNAEKREQIEAEYEAKKLDLQKKYADVDMGIQIAQALVSGAVGMVQAWNAAGGNPVLAAVIMALIGATTAASVATIIAQRNAIKNMAPGSSGGSGGPTQVRTANGYSEGGYTGDGGRLEVAGVVHRGEYVVPQPELRDPQVAAMVANIESRRRRRTSANALPGFAEGGYTGFPSGGRQTEDLLSQILTAVRDNNENPIPAYVVLSDVNAQQEVLDRFKKQTSLRRKP